ncbi:MAG: GYD domain-containing protein [Methanospirillum sp.]
MNFVALVRFRGKTSRDRIAENLRTMEAETNDGVEYLGIYRTLGRYDAAVLFGAPDEGAAMKAAIPRGDRAQTETLVAVSAEEARRLVG